MVGGAKVVAIGKRNDCQLIVRRAGCRVDHGCEVIVPDSWPPITILVHQFCFPVPREIAQADQGCVAGLKNALAKVRGHLDGGFC